MREVGADLPARRGPESGPPSTLSSGDLDKVIRRAVELQFAHGDREVGDGVDEAEAVRIGREVGIEPRHMRRALGEFRAESLVPDAPPDAGLFRSLGGSGFVQASRAVPRSPPEVEEALDEHFREGEALTAIRRRAGRSFWEPAGGVMAGVQRAFQLGGRSYHLAKAASVELAITALEDGFSLVTMTADLRNVRGEHLWTGLLAGPAVIGAVGLGVGFALGAPLLAAPAVLAGGWGGGRIARDQFLKEAGRVLMAMEGILDRVETGEPLARRPPPWRERFRI